MVWAGSHDSPKVTELLNALRASNISSDGQRVAPVITPSMPSEISQLLDLPDTPTPRPRTRRPVDAEGRRLPAGPPPPNSWLQSSRWAPVGSSTQQRYSEGRKRCELGSLPGIAEFPAHSSLMATCLRHMARDWIVQRDYNRYYLATLPTNVRTILLSYIAVYGPEDGIGYEGLKSILLPQDGTFDGFGGNDDFERLDLSGSLGRSVFFKHIQELIAPAKKDEDSGESWEAVAGTIPKSLNIPFHSLKYLSLSNPPRNISWVKFLAFAPSVPTVTHLSLANWPTPCLTPNSATTTMSSLYMSNLQYGSTNFYSHTIDNDWSEAASILRRLSKALYSLSYIDVSGCVDWFPALRWDSPDSPGIDWVSRWGGIRTICMHSLLTVSASSLTVKTDIVRYKVAILNGLELEKFIRRKRGWITVETDEWDRYDELWIDAGGGSTAAEMDNAYREAKVGAWAGSGHLASSLDTEFWI
jgi:hypothetical protein